jgi:hypothetical protein
MSARSTTVTPAHFEYLARRTRGDDDFLKRLKEAAAAAGMPAIWISPEQASFMQILLKAAGAREVIEVGTLAGYSAIAMARALPAKGLVRTIELNEAFAISPAMDREVGRRRPDRGSPRRGARRPAQVQDRFRRRGVPRRGQGQLPRLPGGEPPDRAEGRPHSGR